MRSSALAKSFGGILLALAFLAAPAPAGAACSTMRRPCILDSHCCPGLVCGPGRTCQAGCRIDRVFRVTGARNPSNACQSCQPHSSISSWSDLSDGASCDDLDPCTAPDACEAGVCLGGPPRDCDDGDPCTTDTCDPAVGCEHLAAGCDDGNPCTLDACDPSTGLCGSVDSPTACDDSNPCTDDSCDPVAGCAHAPGPGPCDDGNACTTQDACVGIDCVGGPPPVCEDDNPCTFDSCEPAAGCVHDGGPLLEPIAPGAFLVFPEVVASSNAEGARIETLLTITNISSRSIVAHVSFVNGDDEDPKYCYECDFDVPLNRAATTTLLVARAGRVTKIRNLDSGATRHCAHRVGFVTVDVEDSRHRVRTDNLLTGSEVVVNYTAGSSHSVPAIAVQGSSGDGDRTFEFDGGEYRKFPSFVETEFFAPDPGGPVAADLVLFTLGFRRQFPPLTDCSVIGWDLPQEGQFSSSFQFGCWTSIRLQDIDPEFARPHLGSDRGGLRLRCTVRGTGVNVLVHGGVHGILVQTDAGGVASGRLLDQSPSAGCPMTLRLAEPYTGWPRR